MRVFLWLVLACGLFVAGLGRRSGRARNLLVESWVEEEMDNHLLTSVEDTDEDSGEDRNTWVGPSSEPNAEGDESDPAESPQNTDETRSPTGNDNNPLGAARAQGQQPLWLDDYSSYKNNYNDNLTLGEKIKRFIGLNNFSVPKNVVPPLPTYPNDQQNQNVVPVADIVQNDSQRHEQQRNVTPGDTVSPESYKEHEYLQATMGRREHAEHKGFRKRNISPQDITIPREPKLPGEPTPSENRLRPLKHPQFFEVPKMQEGKLIYNSNMFEDKAPIYPEVSRKQRASDTKLPEEPKFPKKMRIKVPIDTETWDNEDNEAPAKLRTVESLVQLKNVTGADSMVINNITILENITIPRNVTLIRNINVLENMTSLNVTEEKEDMEKKLREGKTKLPSPSRYKFMPFPIPQEPEGAGRRAPPAYELPVPLSIKPKAPPQKTPPLSEIPIPVSPSRPEAQPSWMRHRRVRRPHRRVPQPARKNTTVLNSMSHLVNITVPDNQTVTHRSGASNLTMIIDGIPGGDGVGAGGNIVLPHNITVIVNNDEQRM